MSNTFPPKRPKSILYSVHTLYTIDLFLSCFGKEISIVDGGNYNGSTKKGKESNESRRVRARCRNNKGR